MRWRLAFWLACGTVLFALTSTASPHINDNFHPIVVGEAYRSAQPTADEIRAYFKQYKIATIINLRGANLGSRWYEDEIRISKQLGIRHVDFAMSARRPLTPRQAMQLVGIMKNARKPLLVHCWAGADRTGLASSLYLAGVSGSSEQAAESQLSLKYGHLSIPVLGAWEMNLSWEAVEPFIGFRKS